MFPAPRRCGADPSQDSPTPSPIPGSPAPQTSWPRKPGTCGHTAPRHPGSVAASATPWTAPPRSAWGSVVGRCRNTRHTTECAAAPPGSRASGCGRPAGAVLHRRAAQSETRRCPAASRCRPAPSPPHPQPSPLAPGPVGVSGPPTGHSTIPPSSPGRPQFQLLPRGFILQGNGMPTIHQGMPVRARLGRFYGEVTTSTGTDPFVVVILRWNRHGLALRALPVGGERHLSAHWSKARTSSEGRGQRPSDVSPVSTMSTMVWSETLSPGHPASQAPREFNELTTLGSGSVARALLCG